ncbi:MAG: hypothetical protein M3285_11010 [Actinomycetota bacterium]|nr:hypothetical protein [Actinomycetota bacterium]
MQSSFIAALVAAVSLVFIEAFGRFYPARATWTRLRRARGRLAVRRMRERFEAGSHRKSSRILAGVLLALVIAWVAASSLLDKRWWEVVLDVVPYAIVGMALLRTPYAMQAVAERMLEYEKQFGDDRFDDGEDGEGPTAPVAL